MAQIGSVVLNVIDAGRAAAFRRDALGYVRRAGLVAAGPVRAPAGVPSC